MEHREAHGLWLEALDCDGLWKTSLEGTGRVASRGAAVIWVEAARESVRGAAGEDPKARTRH